MNLSPEGSRFLSKSQFFRGTRCSKAWKLFWSHSELKTSRLDNHDVFQIASKEISLKARQRFPLGEEITGNTEQKLSKTLQAVQNKTPTIYNARFQRDKVSVSVDILKFEKNHLFHC